MKLDPVTALFYTILTSAKWQSSCYKATFLRAVYEMNYYYESELLENFEPLFIRK